MEKILDFDIEDQQKRNLIRALSSTIPKEDKEVEVQEEVIKKSKLKKRSLERF